MSIQIEINLPTSRSLSISDVISANKCFLLSHEKEEEEKDEEEEEERKKARQK